MKKGVSESNAMQVWEVRVAGLPRLLIEATSRATAEAIYKERYRIKSAVIFAEVVPCQPQQTESKQP